MYFLAGFQNRRSVRAGLWQRFPECNNDGTIGQPLFPGELAFTDFAVFWPARGEISVCLPADALTIK
jgi:hypothetical protein